MGGPGGYPFYVLGAFGTIWGGRVALSDGPGAPDAQKHVFEAILGSPGPKKLEVAGRSKTVFGHSATPP